MRRKKIMIIVNIGLETPIKAISLFESVSRLVPAKL